MNIASYLPTTKDITKQIVIGVIAVTLAVIVMRTFPGIKQFYDKDQS